MTNPSVETWTVEDLLSRYDSLGLPHFQRGHVWNTDAVALLLESLFYDTPCGTIILWVPASPKKVGVPLPGGRAEHMRHLVLDGQQRIRSIHDVLTDIDQAAASPDSSVQASTPRWCINLAKLLQPPEPPWDTSRADQALFARQAPRRVPSGRAYLPAHLLPVHRLRGEPAHIGNDWTELPKPQLEAIRDEILRVGLPAKVDAIRQRGLVVLTKVETADENRLADVVQLYNRINSGGLRVQAEERAFATMVSVYDGTNDWLEGLFSTVHESPKTAEAGRLPRDELLKRQRERRFGFKLFMRVLVHAASHHCGYSVGSAGLSFRIVEGGHLRWLLRHQGAKGAKQLFDTARNAIVGVRDVLRNELHCDDFSFLPETTSLTPAFQMLLSYPEAADKHPKLVALLILKLMLAELPQRDLMQLTRAVGATNTLAECADVAAKVLVRSREGNGHVTRALEPHLTGRLKDANSVQDRYVLLLYWLERQARAKDFTYAQLGEDRALPLRRAERPICAKAAPEKQHLVPYSKLKEPYAIRSRGRLSSHRINNIGNLTYISHELNSFDGGLGARALDLALERERASENLRAHLLAGQQDGEDLVAAFRDAMVALESSNSRAEQRRLFEGFCQARRDLIVDGFLRWVAELETEAKVVQPLEHRTEPTARLFATSLADRVRLLDYHNAVEDIVLALVAGSTEHTNEDVGGEQRLVKLVVRWRRAGTKGSVRAFELNFGADVVVIRSWDQRLTPVVDKALAESTSDGAGGAVQRDTDGSIRLAVGRDEPAAPAAASFLGKLGEAVEAPATREASAT